MEANEEEMDENGDEQEQCEYSNYKSMQIWPNLNFSSEQDIVEENEEEMQNVDGNGNEQEQCE